MILDEPRAARARAATRRRARGRRPIALFKTWTAVEAQSRADADYLSVTWESSERRGNNIRDAMLKAYR